MDRATDALDEAGLLLDLLVGLPAGLVVLDADGRVVLYNERESELAGFRPDEVLGRSFFEEVAPCTDVRAVAGRFRHAMAEPGRRLREDIDFEFPFEDGPRQVRIRMRDRTIGGRRFAMLLIDDNTRLKNTEAALREALSRAREEARRDELTGLYNRTGLKERLEEELERARRYGHRVSLLMVDVDDFKSINDAHGHTVGDRVLQRVAGQILGATREPDSPCRYGGDEFLLVLPETGSGGASALADRLDESIRALRFEDHPELRVTASLGRVTVEPDDLPEGPAPLERVLDDVDAALYRDKA